MTLSLSPLPSVSDGYFPQGYPEMRRPIGDFFGNYYLEDEYNSENREVLNINIDRLPDRFHENDLKQLQKIYEELSISSGRADQADMVTAIMEVLASEGYKIPHRLQLLLRNKVSYETVL